MPATLQQTLYWNANPTHTVTDLESGLATTGRFITAAESQDASDTTYARLQVPTDAGNQLNGNAYMDVGGALQTATFSGSIDFVRVKYRGRYTLYVGDGTPSCGLKALCNTTVQGDDVMSTGWSNAQQDFATDPADAQPWTLARINGKTFGARLYGIVTDADWSSGVRTDMSEFSVELWGYVTQSSTPASVAVALAVGVATVVVLSLASCVDIPTSVGTPTVGPTGTAYSYHDSVDIPTEQVDYHELFSQTAPRDPTAVTPLGTMLDGSGGPVTLRCRTAPMYDQDIGTFGSDADGFGVPGTATGTLTVDGFGFGSSSVDAYDPNAIISGIVFYAFVRARKDANVTLSNYKLCNGTVTGVPEGPTIPAYADFALASTALIATDKNGTPWSWTNIFSTLALDARFKADYAFAGGHEFDQMVQLDVAEMWCEVHGPIGIAPTLVWIRHRVGKLVGTGQSGTITVLSKTPRYIYPRSNP